MGIFSSGPKAAADPVAPPGGWFYDRPLPFSLTPQGEAALDDPEAEADL